jgi:uncharacterized membrane protein HdeD (DUF308 family)
MSMSIPFCSLEPNWWVFALRGVLAFIFGVAAMFMPAAAVLAMTIVFGAYALVDGALFVVAGIRKARQGRRWWTLVFTGALGIAAGLIALIAPHVATFALMAFLWTLLGLWAVSTGILEVIAAVRLRREIRGEWLLALDGILSVLLGAAVPILLVLYPLAGMVALGLMIGAYALVSGIVLLVLAYKLRNCANEVSALALE